MNDIDYRKLRLDVLVDLVCSRMIECKDNKTDIIRHLQLDDEGKYIRKTIVEKVDDGYLIGIDPALHKLMVKMGKLVENGNAKRSHYSYGRIYYLSKINILDDELD